MPSIHHTLPLQFARTWSLIVADSDLNDDQRADYPYANSEATRLLSDAINRMTETKQGSLRQLAGKLNYKSAVVLSHMRTGRLPIPIDRAMEIAKITQLDGPTFLLAVLAQRYPDVNFSDAIGQPLGASHSAPQGAEAMLLADLVKAAGKPISELSREQLGVIREVVAEAHPRRRWIGLNEASVVENIRRVYPEVSRDGLRVDEVIRIARTNEEDGSSSDHRTMF